VFGAFVNAAGMTGPVMSWMHRWHARLGSMMPVVTLLYFAGLIVVPALVLLSRHPKAAYGFVLALIPLGLGMWLAHFSYHIVPMPGLELLLLGGGFLLTLHTAWHIARRLAASMWPTALMAAALYFFGVWIVFQPMQMRGTMSMH
jgi:hypothetical protein